MLYPIVSLLRRAAGNIIYIDKKSPVVPTYAGTWLDFDKKVLMKSDKPKLYKLQSDLPPIEAEGELCKLENNIYEQLLDGRVYTVFFGTEDHSPRVIHIGVLLGIHCSDSDSRSGQGSQAISTNLK